MEKSIETIWKEGFLKNDALLAPKLNNLYSQKSIDIVDKFRRMYKINRIAIVAFAFIILPISFLVKIPYMGIGMFVLFFVIVTIAQKFSKRLDTLDKTQNSYQYLLSFDNWVKEMTATNTSLSRFLYPYVFIIMVAGFWFGSIGGDIPGNKFVNFILLQFPDTYLVFGFPLILILGGVTIISLLAYFGAQIGDFDLKLGYGRILKKLDGILADMNELKA
ncbi:hypothetical protein [Flavobacterium degerlachei]|jgi:hypothetical protein|uniref:Uncharacterized protein n=1 Tax=Flavobacterium degerlachei TaxID=229203 RepID=A0A1H2WSJ9_9FLAO|nr:hypothetical protein [Flavobacterium degerlachei]SDW83488.1 hypothetical protein SAMN05444338_10544 [Flavobacterium degerlachei]